MQFGLMVFDQLIFASASPEFNFGGWRLFGYFRNNSAENLFLYKI